MSTVIITDKNNTVTHDVLKSDTVASDVGAVATTGNETIAGIKTFNGDIKYTNGLLIKEVEAAGIPTLADAVVAGNLNGLYYYSTTFYNSTGETEAGGLYASISVTNSKVNLSNIPVSTDSTVTGRRIYRTTGNPVANVLQYLVVDIPNNTSTVYQDNIADSSLGAPVQRINTTGGYIGNSNTGRILAVSGLNTVMGINAMPGNKGYSNTVSGAQAMASNVLGMRNVANGVFSLGANIDGNNNTAGGVHSLNSNIHGSLGTAYGYAALFYNLADDNSAFGALSMEMNIDGVGNFAGGKSSLHDNEHGSNNTASGMEAAKSNISGNFGTFSGRYSAYSHQSGDYTSTHGALALASNIDGTANSVYGANGFYSNVHGSRNVGLGPYAGYYETGSDKLYIDNAQRANEVDGKIKSLIYGEFNADPTLQKFRINGKPEFPYLSEYADNTAALAAGLTAGAVYRTGDLLKVVH